MKKRTFPDGLVLLRTSQNPCYLEVTRAIPKGFVFDPKAKTYEDWQKRSVPFGQASQLRHGSSNSHSPIGLFDTRDFKQLQALVWAVQSITADQSRGAIYCD